MASRKVTPREIVFVTLAIVVLVVPVIFILVQPFSPITKFLREGWLVGVWIVGIGGLYFLERNLIKRQGQIT